MCQYNLTLGVFTGVELSNVGRYWDNGSFRCKNP